MSEELQQVEKLEELENLVQSNKMLVVNFFAKWYGRYEYINSFFTEKSKVFPEAKFIKVEVDKSPEICQKYEIKYMPSFILFKDGTLFERLNEVRKSELIKSIYRLVGKEEPVPEGEINDLNTFEKAIKDNRLVLVMFYNEMRGPFQYISPIFEELKSKSPDIKFIKCDDEKAWEIYNKYNVRLIPTFISFKNGKESERFSGAYPNKLKEIIEELQSLIVTPFIINAHPHPLLEKISTGFICDLCYNRVEDNPKCYRCKECSFVICDKCKNNSEDNKTIEINEDAVRSIFHIKHLLLKTKRSCICDVCGDNLKESFCCEKCDFDICFDCHDKEDK